MKLRLILDDTGLRQPENRTSEKINMSRRHLANILRKLNLSSRTAAAAWGVRTGLV